MDIVFWRVGDDDGFAFESALADQAMSEREGLFEPLALMEGVSGQQAQMLVIRFV